MCQTLESATKDRHGLGHFVGAKIGHFAALDVVPDLFGRIQVGGIGGKPFDGESRALGQQELFHVQAAVSRQTIPNQDDGLATDESFQLAEESDQAFGIETVGFGAGEQAGLAAVPAKAQRGRYRSLAPVIAAGSQDRGLALWGPGSADRGLLREAGFVLEEDPGFSFRSVFFSSGQRTSFQ